MFDLKKNKKNLKAATKQLQSMQKHHDDHLWEDIKSEYKKQQSDYLKEMLRKLQEESEQISNLHNQACKLK